ncbi:MAG: hypothetical protein E7083_05745 [Bacteroidales bacterium]|nr:hypothetical protein [Bacteroidales bacterium]
MAIGKKTGGRKAGTPNKTSAIVRKAIADAVDDYFNSHTFIEDLADLDSKDRITAMEKLAAYVLPKLQATNLDITSSTEKTIEDKLIELSNEDEE